ncbi:FlgD immunoglobulin-like domain containing protein [Candidatus Latescibacterota bacterium]
MRRTISIILYLAVAFVLLTAPVVAESFVVTSSDDSGDGTLRQALLDAQSGDTITFDTSVFPPGSSATISLASKLPELIQGNLTIDASDVGVILDGGQIGAAETFGLSISSNNNIIRGLHIKDFSWAGIALHGNSQNNTIGGDRNSGEGPSGQGNIITCTVYVGNVGIWGYGASYNTIHGNFIGTDAGGTTPQARFNHSISIEGEGANNNLVEDNLIGGYIVSGISISSVRDGHNTIRGNYIGTDTSGVIRTSHSDWEGVTIVNSGYNEVGPSNVIAYNAKTGITIQGEESVGNRITQNSIYENGLLGIEILDGGNAQLTAPVLFDFDLQAGTVTGVACAGCTVEVFSDNAEEGEIYEGQTTADSAGIFSLRKGAPFSRSHLTATATDANGNTSQFSVYTPPDTPTRTVSIQEGNSLPKTRLQTKRSDELADNRIGGSWEPRWAYDLGLKRSRLFLNEGEEDKVDWSIPEFEVPPDLDDLAADYAAHGVTTFMNLNFWDKANHPGGWTEPAGFSRFQTDVDIQRYVEFVLFVVNHFKDRIQYYELWNEPDNAGFPIQHIKVPDYVKVVKQVAPAIRKEYPEAKIMIGAGANLIYQLDYMFELVSAEEIMKRVDVICWHPFYGQSPAYEDSKDYYDQYPSIVQDIKDTAYANGFRGEYFVDEIGWAVEEESSPSPYIYSELQSAKYFARSIVTHLGLDVTVEVAGPPPYYVTQYAVVGNLCTVMAGATTDSVAVDIQSEATNIRQYSFSLPGADKMIAFWTDGAAIDYDPGVTATLVLPDLSDQRVFGIDVLTGFQQELTTEVENGNMVIRDLLIKDYPIILRTDSTPVGVQAGPATFKLGNNYPNPFNPSTSISFQVPALSSVSIKIYNLAGQKIRDVVDKEFEPGFHKIEWNGLDNRGKTVATGLYLIHMKSDDFVKTRKCLLLR